MFSLETNVARNVIIARLLNRKWSLGKLLSNNTFLYKRVITYAVFLKQCLLLYCGILCGIGCLDITIM